MPIAQIKQPAGDEKDLKMKIVRVRRVRYAIIKSGLEALETILTLSDKREDNPLKNRGNPDRSASQRGRWQACSAGVIGSGRVCAILQRAPTAECYSKRAL